MWNWKPKSRSQCLPKKQSRQANAITNPPTKLPSSLRNFPSPLTTDRASPEEALGADEPVLGFVQLVGAVRPRKGFSLRGNRSSFICRYLLLFYLSSEQSPEPSGRQHIWAVMGENQLNLTGIIFGDDCNSNETNFTDCHPAIYCDREPRCSGGLDNFSSSGGLTDDP
jgi:hypothetical protein